MPLACGVLVLAGVFVCVFYVSLCGCDCENIAYPVRDFVNSCFNSRYSITDSNELGIAAGFAFEFSSEN